MAIHAICLVKNELDIIAQTLATGSEWADSIYVLDNGSEDGTWEFVKEAAATNPKIVPFRQDLSPFCDSMRDRVFAHYRDRARQGDWWCKLDADECYVEDPRTFLASVPRQYNAVWVSCYNYLFTELDRAAYLLDPTSFDGSRAWRDVLRHYVPAGYSEARFIRHWWGLESLPPWNWGPIYPRPIRLRQFMYRSPEQITRRMTTRADPMARGEFAHERREHWRPDIPADQPFHWSERLAMTSECFEDLGDDTLVPQPISNLPESITGPDAGGVLWRKVRRRLGASANGPAPSGPAEPGGLSPPH
ncbi:MAG: glycosyl transferase [Phenylobacterium sp.]|uniref:glycosyltransferase family 2 protein n=1 Tax=Phenylobacterium sp. TaxID=1871053 RepID=UPI0026008FFB|nr:glycosyltransferase family 2 protein [Phenylobacterium sp.]MBA4011949.1 glycosyl transferase [Phenylobacterium sp.]